MKAFLISFFFFCTFDARMSHTTPKVFNGHFLHIKATLGLRQIQLPLSLEQQLQLPAAVATVLWGFVRYTSIVVHVNEPVVISILLKPKLLLP